MSADNGEGSGQQFQRLHDGSPWLMAVLRAAIFLAGYGTIWLLVRGQHPYRDPNSAVLAVVFIAVVIAISATNARSLQSVGPGGAQELAYVQLAALSAYLCTGLLLAGLDHAGAARWVVYGVLTATAPLLVAACVWAAAAAMRREWLDYGLCVGLAASAGIGAFFGPTGVWAVTGTGCAIVFLGHAAAREMIRHRRIATA
jgi:hypothetical protein